MLNGTIYHNYLNPISGKVMVKYSYSLKYVIKSCALIKWMAKMKC